MKRAIFPGAALLLLVAINAVAHDYWFAPEAFFLPIGGSTSVHLLVGDEFKLEEERVLQKVHTSRFVLLSARGPAQDLLAQGTDNQTPVARPTFSIAGNYLLVMERRPQLIELAPEKFTAYLTEEGLGAIVAQRAQAGETNKPGRERYSRYLKALFQVGDKHDDSYRKVVAQTLEIVPQSNPYQLQRGDRLSVRITFEGQALADAQVSAYNEDAGKITTQTKATDSGGLVTFQIDRAGVWLIRLVHMRRCANCKDADWESFWGAYSFGVK